MTLRHIALFFLASCASVVLAQSRAPDTPDDQTIADAYVYLLGRMLVMRQERNDLKEPGVSYNKIKYNPLGSADFVNPNLDVAYLEAWLAVDERTPVILEVPQIKDRYYTAQILDEWGEVIANINERMFTTKPYGRFALVKPGSKAKIPQDAARIELHSGKAKMLACVELRGDPESAVRLQKQFKVTPLGKPSVKPALAVPNFTNRELIGVEIFDKADAKIASARDVSPVAAEMQQKVRAVASYVASSADARSSIDGQLRSRIIPEFQEYALTKSAPYRNHWLGRGIAGHYGADYRLRTSVNLLGIWANSGAELMYFVASKDAEENWLHGSKSYVIDFPPGRLPGEVVDAFWSIILVGVPDYRVVPNPLQRYNLNNRSKLAREPDGGMRIAIGPKPVDGIAESNWLPSPEGKPFSLTLRIYVPKDVVLRGEWNPPPVTQVK